jgi:hypothetical protein
VSRATLRAIAAVAAVATTAAAADSRRDAFAVGALRRDGIVLPFAAFDGKRWSAPWPPPTSEDLTVPVTLDAIPSHWWGPTPPLADWRILTANGRSSARVVQPDWVDVHCARRIALRTDYRSAEGAPPRSVQPYPKDGAAVAPPREIEPIAIVPLDSGEVRALVPVVHASFNAAERRTEDRYGHPIARRAREGVLPSIEAVYAYGDDPRIYYVEATRSYRELGQAAGECAALGHGTGWFVRDQAGVREQRMTVDVLDCDRGGASYMLPLGVVRADDRVFWLAQFSGWDHERYVVLEIGKTFRVLVNAWGGGC